MNGVSQITIDGQTVALKFGMRSIRRIILKMGEYELMDGDYYNELGLCHIIYAGYLNACEMKDMLPKIPFEKFYQLVEDSESESIKDEIVAAVLAFEESKYVQEIVGKKKATTLENHTHSTGTK